MGENKVCDLSIDGYHQGSCECIDDNDHLKRTGTVWTASAHIITVVIGSGVLSWATAQLGWIAGPTVMFLFSFVTYYTSTLLAACYCSGDPVNGKRNCTYMDVVRSNLGGDKFKVCGLVYSMNLFGGLIGYTVTSSMSMKIGTMTLRQKIWRSLQAVGIIALAYSYSDVHIPIQDTIKTSSEAKTIMNKAALISIGVTTLLYMLLGFIGYAAFGDLSPENLLTAGFGFCNPCWLIDIANAAVVIHVIGAYRVYNQPLFPFVEKQAAERFPDSEFINKEIKVPIPGFRPYKLNFFRSVWRTIFVILITVISILLPFLNDIADLLGTLGFWPLTAYFPVEMYIARNKIPKWSRKWVCLQILSFACLIVTVAAAAGSIAGIVLDLKSSKPF
ncbi:hypothetical protein Patl1_08283 [Pistacia atlantica]|uniref:Uncharacterized protein n=1 Tax=Pistacia atlantica TaxID=434234 RepID=A0ACC1AJN2_9ROSI|nr:hypothetical protein Patl1_08283 [Pistacia atlantica]